MRRHKITVLATFMFIMLAATAFAGSFNDNGHVTPTTGSGDTTLFTWDVWYTLDEEQETPNGYLKIYDGEWLVGQYMMPSTTVFGQVHYTYTRTLPSGTNYSFQMVTFDDSTLVQFGPTVY